MLQSVTALISSIIIFSSSVTGLFNTQVKTLQTITKLEDNMYMMDYQYDYDIDDMMSTNINDHIQLILYGLANSFDFTKGFACTTFNAVNEQGDFIMGRNYDYMDSGMMLVWTHPKNAYASISSVSLYFLGYQGNFQPDNEFLSTLSMLVPYIPVDGMNEKGLCISVLETEKDPTFQMTSKPNLTTTTMIRACLDKAATVDEAIEIFNTYDMRDMLLGGCNYHYQIADASGKTCVIEYVDNEMNILYPEKTKSNKVDFMAATNYYLTEGVYDPLGMGQDRWETAMNCLKSTKGVVSEKEAMKILQKCSVKNEDMHGYICSTLWSNVFNMTDKTVDVCFFGNFKKTYHLSVNKPLEIY